MIVIYDSQVMALCKAQREVVLSLQHVQEADVRKVSKKLSCIEAFVLDNKNLIYNHSVEL